MLYSIINDAHVSSKLLCLSIVSVCIALEDFSAEKRPHIEGERMRLMDWAQSKLQGHCRNLQFRAAYASLESI